MHDDLNKSYKCITFVNKPKTPLFPFDENCAPRGHELKLVKPRSVTTVGVSFSNQSRIRSWNRLSREIVTSISEQDRFPSYDTTVHVFFNRIVPIFQSPKSNR